MGEMKVLCVFEKLQKATIAFVTSVRLTVLPHGTIRLLLDGGSWNFVCVYSSNMLIHFKFHYNLIIAGTQHEHLSTFMIIPH